jgi:hypothetical protein
MSRRIFTHAMAGQKPSFGFPTARSSLASCRQLRLASFGSGLWRGNENCRIIGNARVTTSRWKRSLAPMQTNDLPMVDVLRLRALDGHRLWLRFTDGSEGVRDLSDILAEGGPMVEPLMAPDYFARAFVEMGVPTWPNGFDLDPINLYMELRDAGALTRVAAE